MLPLKFLLLLLLLFTLVLALLLLVLIAGASEAARFVEGLLVVLVTAGFESNCCFNWFESTLFIFGTGCVRPSPRDSFGLVVPTRCRRSIVGTVTS